MDKVIFLDRDGTINKEVEYLYRPEDLVLLPGAAEGIALMRQEGFRILMDQPGGYRPGVLYGRADAPASRVS